MLNMKPKYNLLARARTIMPKHRNDIWMYKSGFLIDETDLYIHEYKLYKFIAKNNVVKGDRKPSRTVELTCKYNIKYEGRI